MSWWRRKLSKWWETVQHLTLTSCAGLSPESPHLVDHFISVSQSLQLSLIIFHKQIHPQETWTLDATISSKNKWGNDDTIGWQNLNLLSHSNATIAPQARQARASGINLNYLLSQHSRQQTIQEWMKSRSEQWDCGISLLAWCIYNVCSFFYSEAALLWRQLQYWRNKINGGFEGLSQHFSCFPHLNTDLYID